MVVYRPYTPARFRPYIATGRGLMARYDRLRRIAEVRPSRVYEARRALMALRKHVWSASSKLHISTSLYLILLIEHLNDYNWPQQLV